LRLPAYSASAKVICFIGKLGQRDRRISPDSGSLLQGFLNALLDEHISQVRSQITARQSLERQLVSLRANCNDGREVEACGILAGISENACTK